MHDNTNDPKPDRLTIDGRTAVTLLGLAILRMEDRPEDVTEADFERVSALATQVEGFTDIDTLTKHAVRARLDMIYETIERE